MTPGLYLDPLLGDPVQVLPDEGMGEQHLVFGVEDPTPFPPGQTQHWTPAVVVSVADLDAVLQHAYEVRGGSVDRWPEYANLKGLLDARLKEQTP